MSELLSSIGEKIGKKQSKNPKIFFILLIILLAVTLPGMALLLGHIEPSLEKILPQEIETVKTMNDMRSQFSADMMYIVITTDYPTTDVRSPEIVTYVSLLSDRIRSLEYVKEVQSISDAVIDREGFIPNSQPEIESIISLDPRTGIYINTDNTYTVIHVRSDTGANAKVIDKLVKEMRREIELLESQNPGVESKITGFNSIDNATFNVIIKDFQYITGFTMLFIVVFLFLYLRNWKKVVSSMSVILISVLITLGITGYANITITVVTMVSAAMIMSLGISYGINVTFEYYLIRKKYSKNETLTVLNSSLIRALLGSSLTTTAGFLALLFGIIPAMKNLGIVLAIGIIVTLIVSILFLPVILYSLDTEDEKRKIKTRKK
ncbi:MAG: MMPL family transporter [Candidatus Woesearchaeota archaeon]